jgi:hypothetical protein
MVHEAVNAGHPVADLHTTQGLGRLRIPSPGQLDDVAGFGRLLLDFRDGLLDPLTAKSIEIIQFREFQECG